MSKRTMAAWPSAETWSAFPRSSGLRTLVTAGIAETRRVTSSTAPSNAGLSAVERGALDQDDLPGGLARSSRRGSSPSPGLAGKALVVAELPRPDHAADRDGGDDEGEPAERGRLPVRGAPAPRAGCEIASHGVVPSARLSHESRLATAAALDNGGVRCPALGLPPGREVGSAREAFGAQDGRACTSASAASRSYSIPNACSLRTKTRPIRRIGARPPGPTAVADQSARTGTS